MTAEHFTAELGAVADEGLFSTNPVWSVDRLLVQWEQQDTSWAEIPIRLPRLVDGLIRQQIPLPRTALERWSTRSGIRVVGDYLLDQPSPGFVGLTVDVSSREAFVVPLAVQRANEWSIDPTLPFRPATALQDFLLRLLDAHHLTRAGAVPERFAFSVRDPLGRRSDGPSMFVAAVLAVIRELNGHPEILKRGCAVVQPKGDELVPCGVVREKLDAFVRECDKGTLLVRTPGSSDAKAYDSHFDTVWEVTQLSDLARLIADRGWFAPFLSRECLSTRDAITATAQAQRLEQVEHRYGQALDLLNRVSACGFHPEVPARVRQVCRDTVIDLYRHLGAYQKAVELSAEAKRAMDGSRTASYDDRARADLTYAASLFAHHRFVEIRELLAPWREKLISDPQRVSAQTRVMLFNTLARALSAAGDSGWEPLLSDSETLLQEIDPADLPRTWSYLAHALLRNTRLIEASEVIVRIEHHPGLGEVSRWFFRFLQAELARQEGRISEDPEMEQVAPSPRVGHPFGLYFQATARQPGRSVDDALRRFKTAKRFFDQDRPDGDPQNIQEFLSDCMLLADAAWAADGVLWERAIDQINGYFAGQLGKSLAQHYARVMPPSGSEPDRGVVNKFLARVPFF